MDKKAIVKLNGGLGNQMFQYAFAYATSRRFHLETFFDFSFFEDVKLVDSVTNRDFELHSFNIECKEVSKEDLKKVIFSKKQSKLKIFLWKKLNVNAFIPSGNNYIQKDAYEFDNMLLKVPFAYYNGYFQNEKYFKDYRSELVECFSLKDELDEKNKKAFEEIKNTNSVSLHVRRGDYVNLESAKKIHGICLLDYYEKAIGHICKNVQDPHFYIFSDDIEWVKENIKIDAPVKIIDFNLQKGWLDLNLMKNCKHNIIANSSFSWWGAWLNQNEEKIVVCPKKWTKLAFKNSLALKEWIKF